MHDVHPRSNQKILRRWSDASRAGSFRQPQSHLPGSRSRSFNLQAGVAIYTAGSRIIHTASSDERGPPESSSWNRSYRRKPPCYLLFLFAIESSTSPTFSSSFPSNTYLTYAPVTFFFFPLSLFLHRFFLAFFLKKKRVQEVLHLRMETTLPFRHSCHYTHRWIDVDTQASRSLLFLRPAYVRCPCLSEHEQNAARLYI